jgi:regulator of sirC expression with transglutaminase-like and TPR domain
MAEGYPKDTSQQRVYRALEALVAGEDASIDLTQAVLLIASTEFPDLDMAQYMAQLDALARRVRVVLDLPPDEEENQLPPEVDPLVAISALNKVLFEEEGFHGNQEDYYNPHNSLLNKVLEERTGIPITLSLIYMEVGRRVGIAMEGIALPFHFVVGCRLPQGRIYIDPFNGGQLLSERDCRDLIRRIAKGRIKIHPQWFEPVSHKQILIRVLNNLKNIYIDKEDFARALTICNFLVLLTPHDYGERRDRGVIHLQLKHYAHALHDLTAYIENTPHASDRYEVLNYIKTIRNIMAMMN